MALNLEKQLLFVRFCLLFLNFFFFCAPGVGKGWRGGEQPRKIEENWFLSPIPLPGPAPPPQHTFTLKKTMGLIALTLCDGGAFGISISVCVWLVWLLPP